MWLWGTEIVRVLIIIFYFKGTDGVETYWNIIRNDVNTNQTTESTNKPHEDNAVNINSKPTMVFSVIGDSDSFVPRPWPTTLFQTALIEAAKSGGGIYFWIEDYQCILNTFFYNVALLCKEGKLVLMMTYIQKFKVRQNI